MPPRTITENRHFEGIPYTLVRSPRRKTAAILIEPGGEITVRVPRELDDATIDELLVSRRARILRAVAEQEGLPEPEEREFKEGATFPFLGVEHPIRFDDSPKREISLEADGFRVKRHSGVDAESRYQQAFRKFYTKEGRQYLWPRVAERAEEMGVEPAMTRVLHLGNRWGSCSPKGAVNFHWRVMMAPPEVIDYLIVHELAHLEVPDHSRDFWRLVESVLPDHEVHHTWLRRHGVEMDL